MIKPQFPYLSNQCIITSDRVTLHSRKDGIYLFGKATVCLSSPGTVNIESNEALKISAPIIELGLNARDLGQPVVLGLELSELLDELIQALQVVAVALSKADGTSEEAVADSFDDIKVSGESLVQATDNAAAVISTILSTKTYTL
jgi:hypothetical protein